MNAARRKEIAKAIGLLVEAKTIIEQARDDEQSSFDNMPEGLQQSERGQSMEEAAGTLDEIYSQIEEAESNAQQIAGE